MLSKFKAWREARRQKAECKFALCDCKVVAKYEKTIGIQKYTKTVSRCPHCGRKQTQCTVELIEDKMNQVVPKPKVKKTTKKPVRAKK